MNEDEYMTMDEYLDTLEPDESAYEVDNITDYRWVLDKKD